MATAPVVVRSRREELALAFFGTWMIGGLFIDGWAHQADKPETFFTPWHGVLYSGFVAAVAWFMWDGRKGPFERPTTWMPAQRLAALGLGLFVLGAVGDGAWHEIFGVEVDLEALLSPTHLLLLIGGFLMITTPLRAAWADASEQASSFLSFLPQIVTLTLATALVSFFTMYLSAFWGVGGDFGITPDERELEEVTGVASVLVTNLILLAPTVWVLRRWRPPVGTFTVMFGVVGLAMTGIDGFEVIELAIPAVVAGAVADLAARRVAVGLVAGAVPLVLWSGYFAVAELSYGIALATELWTGCIVLASMSGFLLAALMRPYRDRAGTSSSSPVSSSSISS